MGRMASLVLLEPFEQVHLCNFRQSTQSRKDGDYQNKLLPFNDIVGLSAAEKADQVRFNFGFGLAPHRPPTAVRVAILH